MPGNYFKKDRIIFLVTLCGLFYNSSLGLRNEDVSLYGESYIQTPFKDANSSTSISFKFRTLRSRGLLLLAAGKTDYILIQLNNGIVETRVNLGSGEAVVFSARGVRLHDGRWHSVAINRTLDTIFLEVDGIGQGQGSTPGTYNDLNIDVGVLLGGKGNLEEDYLRNVNYYRGCLRSVMFNDRNVISEAKAMKSSRNAFQVSWHCDDGFFASDDLPISFSTDTSFAAFPALRIYQHQDAIFSCEFKTRSTNAILVFNSGQGSAWEDFLAVELAEGKVKLTVDKGSGIIELYVNLNANDGQWHQLEMTISETTAKLQVDAKHNTTRFHLGGKNILNLANYLYVGGVGFQARDNAIKLGLGALEGPLASRGSMLGCVRNIEMNSRSFGFRRLESSHSIDAGCGWDYPCAKHPCIAGAKCMEMEGSDFRCDCDQKVCTKDEYRAVSLERNKDVDGIFSVQELKVSQGRAAIIDFKIVKPSDGILKAVTRESGVVFTIEQYPRYGRIEIRDRPGTFSSFTLQDLKNGLLYYRHAGRSTQLDSTVLKVRFSSLNQEYESRLRDTYQFVIPIRVEERSTKSLEVILGFGQILSLSDGARVRITSKMVNVREPMPQASSMIFSIKFLRTANSHFELAEEPGKAITSFSLKDVQEGAVYFQHKGDRMVYTKISVSDGVSESDEVDLRFKEEPLKLSVVNHTGIFLDYGGHKLISSHNLSTSANVKFEEINIVYHIIYQTSHGAIQKFDPPTSQWVNTQAFDQRQIDLGYVRYSHQPGHNIASYDQVKFEARAKDFTTRAIVFNIRFKTVTLNMEHDSDLVLRGKSFGKLSNSSLLVVSGTVNLNLENIIFTVLRPPQYGSLYLSRERIGRSKDLERTPSLKIDSTFTQQDVSDGFVYYKLTKMSMDELMDYADLQASYFGYAMMVRVMIQYLPGAQQGQLIVTGLNSVKEGGSSVITSSMLFIANGKFTEYTYTLHTFPKHGAINIVDPKTGSTLRTNTSYFTQAEILSGKVVYWHRGSENDKDFFMFTVVPITETDSSSEDEEVQVFSGKFHIIVTMKNDNAPVRVINKVFKVVANLTKHLTIKDLAYKDDDIGTDLSKLTYSIVSFPNGKLFRERTKEEIFNFTQGDLEAGALIFKHSGASHGRANIIVSDGQYQTSGQLEVEAMDPFISVITKTDIVVRAGQKVLLTVDHVSLLSNMDFLDALVNFQITEAPQFGHILLNGGQVSKFSYANVLDRKVQYSNEDGDSGRDFFKFTVHLGKLTNQSTCFIEVEADGMRDPPEIVHNQILDVISYHSEAITSDYLHVSHPNFGDADIEFIVTRLPERGHLRLKGKPVKKGSAPEFTQQDINDGLLMFTSDSSEIIFDSFVFDVGTEYQSLRQVEYLINVLPQESQTNQANLKVDEGGYITLERDLVPMSMRLVSDRKTRIVVEPEPEHGSIFLKNDMRRTPVTSFSLSRLSQGSVVYGHDGSENHSDNFSLSVRSPDSSVPRVTTDFTVEVNPINDESPYVVVNTGLDVWTGSITLLRNESLQVADPDSNNEELEYVTSTPTNGRIAYLKNVFQAISRFSQSDIDNERVVFVHKGSQTGEFNFRVTDGVNSNDLQVFHIHALPIEIVVATNVTLEVYPNILHPVLNSSLLATASSANFTDDIEFTIVKPFSTQGKMISVINSYSSEVRSFTQRDINEGKIFYKHFGLKRVWYDIDYINLEISTSYAEMLSNLALVVNASYVHINEYNYKDILNINMPYIKEGDNVVISEKNLDPLRFIQNIQRIKRDVEVEFSVASPPYHGQLRFNGNEADIGAVFTRENLASNELVYYNDHSDNIKDRFQFTVKILVPRSENEASLSSAKTLDFPIRIIPVNDKPFTIITVLFRISVIQGEEAYIRSQNLTTVDLDTGPEGIMYKVMIQPKNGMVIRESAPNTRIVEFTQKDIDDNKIKFKHNGLRNARSIIRLRVTDGRFPPQYFNMSIYIIPLKIIIAPDRGIPLFQGKDSVVLKSEHLKVTTTGDYDALTYKITQAPQFGKLLRGNSRPNDFTQKEVDQGLIVYVQDYDSTGEDFFVCDISLSNIDCSQDTVQFEIVMKPLVKQGPLVTAVGSQMAITRASLDASELAQITNDDPRFDIVKPPKHGYIVRRNRQKREARVRGNFTPVSNFTFDDIIYTRIYFMAKSRSATATQDSFSYSLSAKGVPPARGEFLIKLDPAEESTDGDTGTGEWPDEEVDETITEPPTDDGGKSTDSDDNDGVEDKNDSNDDDDGVEKAAVGVVGDDDSIMIAVIVVGIILVLVVCIVVGVCLLRKRRRNVATSSHDMSPMKTRPYISGPLQLEQPHVFIEPQQDAETPMGEEDTALMNDHEDHMYMNTSHVNNSHVGDNGDPRQRNAKNSNPTGDRSLPENHITQLPPDCLGDEGVEDGDGGSNPAGGRGSNASTDLMEWTLMDPDILQHCYNATPVLRNNQYWL